MDTHCHIDHYPHPNKIIDEISDRELVVFSVTNTPSSFPSAKKIAQNVSSVYTGIGLHPHLVKDFYNELDLISEYIFSADFIGEIGLDGCPSLSDTRTIQLEVFKRFIDEADRHCCKVLSVHSRYAATQVIDILKPHRDKFFPILHWFSGTRAELNDAINIGCWFSVGPAMLNSKKGLNLVREIPLDRILLETDGPFIEANGRTCMPWDAYELCPKLISDVTATPLEEIEEQLFTNLQILLTMVGQE